MLHRRCKFGDVVELFLLTIQQAGSKAGMTPADWSSTVSKLVGGKAGGKAPTAIGNGTDTTKTEEALTAATEYLEKFKL